MLTPHTAQRFEEEISLYQSKDWASDDERNAWIAILNILHRSYEEQFGVFVSQCRDRPDAAKTLKQLGGRGYRSGTPEFRAARDVLRVVYGIENASGIFEHDRRWMAGEMDKHAAEGTQT